MGLELAALPLLILLSILALGVGVWYTSLRQIGAGEPLVPLAHRRPVPWHGGHVAMLVIAYLCLQILVPVALEGKLGPVAPRKPSATTPAKMETEHAVARLLRSSHRPLAIVVCLVTAGLLAPVCEEFLFRLVLQGWLEKREWRARFRQRWRRSVPPGLFSVGLVALLFAAIHARAASPELDEEFLLRHLLGAGIANLATFALGILLLRFDAGATATDLGFPSGKWKSDVLLGVRCFLGVAAVIYPLQLVLPYVLPAGMAPDPISLLPFALVVGVLYFRTHRLLPSIVVHMTLNATSLLLALL